VAAKWLPSGSQVADGASGCQSGCKWLTGEVAAKWLTGQVAAKWLPSGWLPSGWLPSGCQVAAKWLPSGCQLPAKWLMGW